jgi:hypothetical protein
MILQPPHLKYLRILFLWSLISRSMCPFPASMARMRSRLQSFSSFTLFLSKNSQSTFSLECQICHHLSLWMMDGLDPLREFGKSSLLYTQRDKILCTVPRSNSYWSMHSDPMVGVYSSSSRFCFFLNLNYFKCSRVATLEPFSYETDDFGLVLRYTS